jgi:hypothetical protein
MKGFFRILVVGVLILTVGCNTTRLKKVQAGMTRTDVAIQLGKPVDIQLDGEVIYWSYPSSDSEICRIKFTQLKVSSDVMSCDSSDRSREIAVKNNQVFVRMNSEFEHQLRQQAYCGLKPVPRKGCKVKDECMNGGWEEICE